jgi:outer membrane protein TolC
MTRRPNIILAALLASGCASGPSIGPVEREVGGDAILETLERRAVDYRGDHTGEARWAMHRGSDYQKKDDIEFLRRRPDIDRKRADRASRLVASGPLTLTACLSFALEFNDSLQARLARLKAEAGEELISRSRLMPQLSYEAANASKDHETGGPSSTFDNYLRLSQTFAEFGREHADSVRVRAAARAALFAYENEVSDVLSGARRKFYTIILRQQQIAERLKLLEKFRVTYRNKQNLIGQGGRATTVDVLTAQLNVLNEEARINSLRQEMLRQKIDLLHLIGFPVNMTNAKLGGKIEEFLPEVDAAVRTGLLRNTSIASARATAAEQLRVVREVKLRNGADLSAAARMRSDTSAVGVNLTGDDGLYSLSGFAEHHLQNAGETGWAMPQTTTGLESPGWSASVNLSVPILDGNKRRGAYIKERALLLQQLHELREKVDATEAGIRKAYQTLLERRAELDIAVMTVDIAQKRLDAQEELKNLGKITDDQLETFRNRFFSDQDSYLRMQISLMEAQESLRHAMRFFEPLPEKGRE